jgi:hypothetical protein
MVKEVRGLRDHLCVALCDARERELESFLADLLRDAPGSRVEEFRCVAARRPRVDALFRNS